MKKFVRIVSLSVALCLCCCFSTFGSVKAFAIQPIEGSYVDSFILTTYSGQNRELLMRFGPSFSTDYWADLNTANCYVYDNAAESVVNSITFGTSNTGFEFEYLPSLYDYYIYLRVHSNSVSSNNDFTFYPTMAGVYYYDDMTSSQVWSVLTDLSVETYNDRNQLGFQFCGKLNAINSAQFNYLRVVSNNGSVPADLEVEGLIVAVDKSQNSSTQSIVAAINNQTSSLGGKLDGIDSSVDQAADDIQQSIEDQYQMEEEEDFGFSDIQEQYEEKMGVLTFGTETTLQMLDLFSPSNAGEAYIRVPGWSMDIQGETYNVWNEYTFYFSWIEDWIPLLVRLMRTFNVTMFYIAILMYINKVYERNFLAK